MKTGEKALYLVVIVLLITLGALGWLYKKKSQRVVEVQKQVEFLTDTVQMERNAKGEAISKIGRLTQENTKSFLAIKNLTGTNKYLQDVVSANKSRLGSTGSATIMTTITSTNTTVPTQVTNKDSTLIASNTQGKPDTVKYWPQYSANIKLGRWVDANIIATKDSTTLTQKIVNEYEIMLGEEPVKGTGFLGIGKTYKPFSEVKNLNPYSETPVLKTYSVDNTIKPRRWSLGLQATYGIGILKPGLNAVLGLGLNYRIL